MTNEELVSRIQGGEGDLMLALWTQTVCFVRRQAYRACLSMSPGAPVTQEDLIQSGYLALVVAVETFDPDRGKSFVGWLALKLKTAFAEAGGWRSSKRDPLDLAVSLNAPLDAEEGGGTLENIVEDPGGAQGFQEAEERLWTGELRATLEQALESLPEPQGETIRRRYFQGQDVDNKAHTAALRSLRHPRCFRQLADYRMTVGTM